MVCGDLVVAIRCCPVPVVARVQGLCLAGGVGLALGCDVVLASSAAAFGLPEVDLGLWPFMVSALLAVHVSPKVAIELMLTGRRIDATEAGRSGWSAGCCRRRLRRGGRDPVAALAARPPGGGPARQGGLSPRLETPLVPALDAMQAQLSLLTTTADAAEGVAAFFGSGRRDGRAADARDPACRRHHAGGGSTVTAPAPMVSV